MRKGTFKFDSRISYFRSSAVRVLFIFFAAALVTGVSSFNSITVTGGSVPSRIAFEPRLRVSFYPVEGGSAELLKASMLERGPIGHGNKRFFAYTFWHFKLSKNKANLNLNCRISVLMPYLWQPEDKSEATKRLWKRFYSSTIRHESNHVRMAMRSCRQIKNSNLSEKYLSVASRRLKKRDRLYDLHTQHGRLEGVVLH